MGGGAAQGLPAVLAATQIACCWGAANWHCTPPGSPLQLDEEGAEKISTVQEAADLIAAQVRTGCLILDCGS